MSLHMTVSRCSKCRDSWLAQTSYVIPALGFVFAGCQTRSNLVGGLEHEFYDFPYIGNFITPTDFHSIIFQRGRLKPPTRYDDSQAALGFLGCFLAVGSPRKSNRRGFYHRQLSTAGRKNTGLFQKWGLPYYHHCLAIQCIFTGEMMMISNLIFRYPVEPM